MTTHQLYIGGVKSPGSWNRSQFPAKKYVNTDPLLAAMDVSSHKDNALFALTRTLDFGRNSNGIPNDPALLEYLRNNPLVQGDILNLQVIPANTLLLGVALNLENPPVVASPSANPPALVAQFGLDDGTLFGGSAPVATPTGLGAVAAGSGSTLPAGTYKYAIASNDLISGGASAASPTVTLAVGAGQNVTITFTTVVGITSYTLYRSVDNGVTWKALVITASPFTDSNPTGSTSTGPVAFSTSGNNTVLNVAGYTPSGYDPMESSFADPTKPVPHATMGFSAPNQPGHWAEDWWGFNVVDLSTANFSNVPRMLQMTLSAFNPATFGNSRISVSPLLLDLRSGQY